MARIKGTLCKKIPLLYNVDKSIFSTIRRLRKENFVIIDDYLSFSNYFEAIHNFIKSIFSPKYFLKYPDFNIKFLLLNEQLVQSRTSGNIRFWLNGIALKNWSSSFNHISYINTFELMPPEHTLVHYLKKTNHYH